MVVEPFAGNAVPDNLRPVGCLYYPSSPAALPSQLAIGGSPSFWSIRGAQRSQAVRNRWQVLLTRKRRNQARTVATGCDELSIGANKREDAPHAFLLGLELGTGIGTDLSAPHRTSEDGSGAESPLPSSDGPLVTELQNRRNRCSPSVGRFDSYAAPLKTACIYHSRRRFLSPRTATECELDTGFGTGLGAPQCISPDLSGTEAEPKPLVAKTGWALLHLGHAPGA